MVAPALAQVSRTCRATSVTPPSLGRLAPNSSRSRVPRSLIEALTFWDWPQSSHHTMS